MQFILQSRFRHLKDVHPRGPAMSELQPILNRSEQAADAQLRESCERHGARVCPLVRVKDIVGPDEHCVNSELFTFSLRSHFDFVVIDSDSTTPLFAVEFDGPFHRDPKQRSRDQKKNALCDIVGLPLLRVNDNYLKPRYRNLNLLAWFVECWFASKCIEEAQRKGHLPDDEYFDPSMFLSIPGLDGHWPLWLSTEPLIAIQRLADQGKCHSRTPSYWVGKNENDVYRGIAWAAIDGERAVITNTAMRFQRFPVSTSDAVSEILAFDIYDRVSAAIERSGPVVQRSGLASEVERLQRGFQMVQLLASQV